MATETDPTIEPAPPVPPARPEELVAHGDRRVDNWGWLRNRDDPAVLEYLQAENAYADAYFEQIEELTGQLYDGIKRRVQEDDVSAPTYSDGWWYWSATVAGEQYTKHFRLRDEGRIERPAAVLELALADQGELVLDENELAAGGEYFALGIFDIDDSNELLAYATDTDGSERYRLGFKDLASGADLPDIIEGVTYGSAWARDTRTFFYVRTDDAMRPYQVWSHVVGEAGELDRLIFEEPDERFFVSVGRTRSKRFVLIQSESKLSSETRYIDAEDPSGNAQVLLARAEEVEYDADHAVSPTRGDVWLIRSNAPGPDGEPATNFAIALLPLGSDGPPEVVIEHRPEVKLEAVDVFASHVIIAERAEGLERLRVFDIETGDGYLIDQPDPVYSLVGGANPEWESTEYRYGYTSLVTPISTIDYDVATRLRTTVKVQPVLGGYEASDYTTERLWARADDGTAIPVSLVYRVDLTRDGRAPLLLYGYGAYEATMDPRFSAARLNLLERGVVYAIAHVRGGGEMGRAWHEQGRLGAKANTFDDFLACAHHLIDLGFTTPERLAIRGGSAGGLLIGAVLNIAPELFSAAVAEVPFVDVVTTMSDKTLPLTVTEWEEWGNPAADPEAYATMKSYSPYDNVRAAPYPALYVTAGLNDPRVGYWEPAKWVAKLRTLNTSARPILLHTEMGAGHGGLSGRYDAWMDEAKVQAFILHSLGRHSLEHRSLDVAT